MMLGLVGVMDIDTNAEGVTVKTWAELFIPDRLAVILVVPVATDVANPVFAPIVATLGVAETQVAVVVMFWVEPSLYVPMAINCWVNPFAMHGLAGVTAIDANAEPVTVNV